MRQHKFNIANKVNHLVLYTLQAVNTSPKKIKNDISLEIRKSAIQVLRLITEANLLHYDIPEQNIKRQECKAEAKVEALVLDSLCIVAEEMNYITSKQYELISGEIQELYDMIDNWKR